VINVSLSFTGDGFQGLLDKSEPAALDTSKALEDYVKTGGASRRMQHGSAATPIDGNLGGDTLPPGAYDSIYAMYLTGILKLDANGDTDPMWIFNIKGAFTVAANAEIQFLNMPVAEPSVVLDSRVKWRASGAISIGASALLTGTMESTAGSIVVGGNRLCWSSLGLERCHCGCRR
jgi:hypothetical protein